MRAAQRLRIAARRIERGINNYSCCAIMDGYKSYRKNALRGNKPYQLPAVWKYLEVWYRTGLQGPYFASNDLQRDIELCNDGVSVRDLRVMLLCMAAAVIEAGGL